MAKNQLYYEAEMAKGGCAADAFLDTSTDVRYSSSGLYTTVQAVQTNNGVQDILMNSPDTTYTATTGNDWALTSWNRATINWSLACEASGKTRQNGLSAMQTASLNSSIDNEFYKRMGLTLTIVFILWSVMSVLVYCLIKRKDIDDRSRIMMLFLYYPGRLAMLVWAPWLGYRAGNDQTTAEANLNVL